MAGAFCHDGCDLMSDATMWRMLGLQGARKPVRNTRIRC